MQTIKNPKIAVPVKDGMAISKERYDKLLFAEKQEEKANKEQIIKQRNDSIKFNKVKIKQLQREIDFKKDEIKNNDIIETTSMTNPQTGITSAFKGGFKPKWLIENEIDFLELQVEAIEANQTNLQEEAKKDVV